MQVLNLQTLPGRKIVESKIEFFSRPYIKVFGEVFGTKAAGEPMEHTLDGGLLILLRRNLQLDIWGGVGLSSPASDYFIGTGLAIRLPR